MFPTLLVNLALEPMTVPVEEEQHRREPGDVTLVVIVEADRVVEPVPLRPGGLGVEI